VNHTRNSALRERLAKAADCLERIDTDRSTTGDPTIGQAIEMRIVWRELLDLELQDFDDQIQHLCEFAHTLLPDRGNDRER